MTLSDKRTNWFKETKWNTDDLENPYPIAWKNEIGFREEDVKETIKKLKEDLLKEFENEEDYYWRVINKIEKHFGKELVEDSQ